MGFEGKFEINKGRICYVFLVGADSKGIVQPPKNFVLVDDL